MSLFRPFLGFVTIVALASPRFAVAAPPDPANASLLVTTTEGKPVKTQLWESSVSKDGRYVVVATADPSFFPGQTSNGMFQIVRHDRKTKKSRVVSLAADGSLANGHCVGPEVSDDGKRIAFRTSATNLEGGGNGKQQVALADLDTEVVRIVSFGAGHILANADCGHVRISGDGTVVAFGSAATTLAPSLPLEFRIYAFDSKSELVGSISVSDAEVAANDESGTPSLSKDGRFVVFDSIASNLPVPNSGFHRKVLLRDRETGTTTLVSRTHDGSPADGWSDRSTISGNGRWIAFTSEATNLVDDTDTPASYDVFVLDRETDELSRIPNLFQGLPNEHFVELQISANGKRAVASVEFDNPAAPEISATKLHVYDLKAATGFRLSLVPDSQATSNHSLGEPQLSGNGRKLWFGSRSSLLEGNANELLLRYELKLKPIS